MLLIRLFEPSDSAEMITLFRRSIHEVACQHYSPQQLDVWAPQVINEVAWTKRCQSRPTWLAYDQDTLAGFVDLEDNGHLDLLYVSPDYQRVGVASSLYQEMEKQARMNDNQRIFVEASLSARPFFLRKGFSIIEEQTVEREGQKLINFRMEKQL